jgi:hypothetical protein
MSEALDLLHALVLEDGRRWGQVAHPFQRQDAAAIIGPGGPRRHLLVRPRGASKTSDVAGVALVLLLTEAPAGSRSYAYAVDQDQAGDLLDALRGMVNRTPGLQGLVDMGAHTVSVKASGAVLNIEASDAASAWNKRPWLVLIDELASWPATTNHRGLWNAIVSALPKRPDSRLVVMTMAGSPSHFSHRVYKTARTSAGWACSHIPGPCPWWTPQDTAQAEQDLQIVTEGEYRRVILAQWVEVGEEVLARAEDIAAAVRADPATLPPAPATTYLAALDVGIRRDYTALAVAHAAGGRVVVDYVRHWRPTRTRRVQLAADVEPVVRAVCGRYRARLLFDRSQAEDLTQRLTTAGVRCEEYTFSPVNTSRLAKSLATALRDGRIEVPDDPELVAELGSTRLVETGYGVKLVNPPGHHDDLAVVVGMLTAALATPLTVRAEVATPAGDLPGATTLSPLAAAGAPGRHLLYEHIGGVATFTPSGWNPLNGR